MFARHYDAPVGHPASLVLHITPSLIPNPHLQLPSVKWCPHHGGEGQVVSLVGAEIFWKCVSKHHRYNLTALIYIVVVFEAPEPEGKQRRRLSASAENQPSLTRLIGV